LDLRRQLAIARKWLPLLILGVVVAAATAFGLSSIAPRVYEARATLIVGQALSALNPDVNQLNVSQRLSATYAAIATRRPALEAVIRDLGLGTSPDELGRRVFAEAPTESTLLVITAQDGDPARAAAIANAVARLLIEQSPAVQGLETELQQFIEAELEATREQIEVTQAEVETLSALQNPTPAELTRLDAARERLLTLRSTYVALLGSSAASAANLLTVIEPAIAADAPVSPRVLLNTLLAAVAGLLLAAAIAALVEYLDDRVKDPEAVQEVAGLSTLGTVARMRIPRERDEFYRLTTLLYPRSANAEAYRTLRTNIEFASVDAPIHTLLVTSARAHEGKTVTAANLAIAFAQEGRRTILVDADLRRPGVDDIFVLPKERGLTTLLREEGATVEEIAHPTEQDNLRVITTGPLPPNPAELLGSERMRRTIDKIGEAAEIVVFDTPPVQVVIDAAVLSAYLDAAVLVVDAGRSRRADLREARNALARAGANLLGVVLNRVPRQARASDSGYYHEGAEAPAVARKPDAAAPQPQRRST
jgi:non-specific protein-tyrosine kinase